MNLDEGLLDIAAYADQTGMVKPILQAIQAMEETKRQEIRSNLLKTLEEMKGFYGSLEDTLDAAKDELDRTHLLTLEFLNILITAGAHDEAARVYERYLTEPPRIIRGVFDLLLQRLESVKASELNQNQ